MRKKITGENRIHMLLGGTHLLQASQNRIDRTITDLKKMKVQRIGVSHCTGHNAYVQFANAFGKEFFVNNAGTTVVAPSF